MNVGFTYLAHVQMVHWYCGPSLKTQFIWLYMDVCKDCVQNLMDLEGDKIYIADTRY